MNDQVTCTMFIKNIDEYNADKERKILIVFDDVIADLINKKELNSKVTELFIRGRKKKYFSYFHYTVIF